MLWIGIKELKDSHMLRYLKAQSFRYVVAIEGENNQDKAETMLMRSVSMSTAMFAHGYSFLAGNAHTRRRMREQYMNEEKKALLVGRGIIHDAAGRTFENMSAYGYAFWAGDTHMRHMMERYMDEKTKSCAYEECQRIATEGVTFTFQSETVTGSKHFDYQRLVNAYRTFFSANNGLIEAITGNLNEAYVRMTESFLDIGKEQAKVPTHIAQEYCSSFPFSTTVLRRSIKFCNADSITPLISWRFSRVQSSSDTTYVIYRYFGQSAYGSTQRTAFAEIGTTTDFTLLPSLFQARTVDDRNQTLKDLKPAQHDVRLTP